MHKLPPIDDRWLLLLNDLVKQQKQQSNKTISLPNVAKPFYTAAAMKSAPKQVTRLRRSL